MTIINLRKWLQENGALQKFLANRANEETRNTYCEDEYQKLLSIGDDYSEAADALSLSMSWNNTFEGQDYWYRLHNKWYDYITGTYERTQGPFKLTLRPAQFKLRPTHETS